MLLSSILNRSNMEFIIFEKHPGDILKTSMIKRKLVSSIKIESFDLRVTSIKLTANWMFKIYIDTLPNNINYSRLITTLNGMLQKGSICEYKLS